MKHSNNNKTNQIAICVQTLRRELKQTLRVQTIEKSINRIPRPRPRPRRRRRRSRRRPRCGRPRHNILGAVVAEKQSAINSNRALNPNHTPNGSH